MDNNQRNPRNNPQRAQGRIGDRRRVNVHDDNRNIENINRIASRMLAKMAQSLNILRQNQPKQNKQTENNSNEYKIPICTTTWEERGPIIIRPLDGVQRKTTIVKTQTHYLHLPVFILILAIAVFGAAIYQKIMY